MLPFPGHRHTAPVGLPAWLGWQHFLNAFLLLVIRTGWQNRSTTRTRGFWTHNKSGLLKIRGKPTEISLDLWFPHFPVMVCCCPGTCPSYLPG